jgi:hypothetical protein
MCDPHAVFNVCWCCRGSTWTHTYLKRIPVDTGPWPVDRVARLLISLKCFAKCQVKGTWTPSGGTCSAGFLTKICVSSTQSTQSKYYSLILVTRYLLIITFGEYFVDPHHIRRNLRNCEMRSSTRWLKESLFILSLVDAVSKDYNCTFSIDVFSIQSYNQIFADDTVQNKR